MTLHVTACCEKLAHSVYLRSPGFSRAITGISSGTRLDQTSDNTLAKCIAVMQVVVDSDSTGKALLANGQLKSRVTIIPLNRV